jgi:hypothetical protein
MKVEFAVMKPLVNPLDEVYTNTAVLVGTELSTDWTNGNSESSRTENNIST